MTFIKKFTNEGIYHIRDKIINEQFLADFDSLHDGEKAEEFINGIRKLGGTTKLYKKYGNSIEDLTLENFYNLLNRGNVIREEQQDFADMECTKIISIIDKKYLEFSYYNNIIKYEGNSAIMEFDYNETLSDFIKQVISKNLDVQLYQVSLEETIYNDDAKVDPAEILKLLSKYMN